MKFRHAIQMLIDAMPDHVAILSCDGTIIRVNEAWKQFSRDNGGDEKSFYVGRNYLDVCQGTSGDSAELGRRLESGLSQVMTEGGEFTAEYTCHCLTELRWFKLIARPLELDGKKHVFVTHHNVTTQKLTQSEIGYTEQDAENLAAIVSTMPDAMIAYDIEGRITNWNPAAQQLYGYSRSEVLGKSLEILYPPNWPMGVKDYIADIVVKGLRHFEAVRLTKTGQPRTIEITAAPIRSTAGEIIGVSNIHRDVTPQREAQLRTRRILDKLYTFVGVLEPDGTLIEANRAPLEAAGLKEDDVVGKKFWDCYWWTYSPETQTQLEDACKRARTGEIVRYDVRVRVAGGEFIWIDFQIAPLFNDLGEVENLIPSGIDISERKSTGEALIVSHDAFKSIVERSPFGIYTVDSDFCIAHVSKGAGNAFANVRPLIGRDLAEALRIIWPESFASEAIARFRHTLATGEAYHAPRTVEERQDIGETEAYDWMIERVIMPDGRPGVVCNFYDLSERERHEEHIRLLMREVNHRAKNLLTVVISMARQTAKDVSPQNFVKHFSQRLLGLSASQDLMVEGNWEGVTVDSLINSQLKHLGPDVLGDQIKLEGPSVSITPEAAQGIGMALHELSTNALKYGSLTVAGGRVSISWEFDLAGDRFRMLWCELGGPTVSPPKKSGFGRTVIEKMAAISVSGNVELDYDETGLTWKLTAPVSKIIAEPMRN